MDDDDDGLPVSLTDRLMDWYKKVCPGGFTETRQHVTFRVMTVVCRFFLFVVCFVLPLVATILVTTNKLFHVAPWFLFTIIGAEFVRQVLDGVFTLSHYIITPEGTNRFVSWLHPSVAATVRIQQIFFGIAIVIHATLFYNHWMVARILLTDTGEATYGAFPTDVIGMLVRLGKGSPHEAIALLNLAAAILTAVTHVMCIWVWPNIVHFGGCWDSKKLQYRRGEEAHEEMRDALEEEDVELYIKGAEQEAAEEDDDMAMTLQRLQKEDDENRAVAVSEGESESEEEADEESDATAFNEVMLDPRHGVTLVIPGSEQ